MSPVTLNTSIDTKAVHVVRLSQPATSIIIRR